MPPVTWSPKALTDVRRLDAYLRIRSPAAASRAIAAILSSVDALPDFPAAGRPLPDMDIGYRELPVPFGSGGYLIFYREHARGIHVLAVRHMREAGY